jgi:cytochrome c553
MPASRSLPSTFLLLLLAGVPAGARAADTDDEDPAALPAGSIARYRALDGSAEIHRVEPLPRLYGAAGDGVHPALRGPFEVSWAGKLIATDRIFTFFLEPCSLEDVTLTVGGKAVRPGEAVKLAPGVQSFALRGTHRKGTPALGLSWQGPKFVREAVPPRAFVHDPADEKDEALRRQARADRGAVLVELLGCFRCHEGPKAWMEGQGRLATAEQLLPGPRLEGIGGRLHAGWVRAWLADPQAVQPGAHMPALFGDSPADRDALDTIAAWLAGGPDAGTAPAHPTGSATKGGQLYAASGCASCHEAPKSDERPPAPALGGVAAKWTAGGLADFLRRPLASRPHGRMPDFGFTAEEAADLAAHLLARSKAPPPAPAAPPLEEQLRRQWRALGEDPARLAALPPAGRLRAVALRQMVVHGCVNCHALGAEADPGIARKSSGAPAARAAKVLAGGPLAGLSAEKPAGGCLAEDGRRGRAPRWTLSRRERESLLAHLASLRPDSPASLAESVRIDLHLLNCTACHRNEGAGGEALTQALGGPAAAKWRTPPDLSGVASRLRPDRLAEYLRHGAGRRPLRPWLGARMPGFGERGGRLALGLLARDGFGKPAVDLETWRQEILRPSPPPSPPPPNHVEMARFLVSGRGLACVNCHAFNGQRTSEIADPTTRGPDLGLVAAHLRPEHFQRLLRDPARTFPGTTMPQMFPPDAPPLLPELRKLNAALPIEALWGYLALGAAAPPPLLPDAGTLTVSAASGPVVQRGVTTVRDRVFGRGIALGFADGTILYDADALRPAAFWVGGFLNSAVDKYFGYSWRPAAEPELLEGAAPTLAFRPAEGNAWQMAPLPADSDPNTGSRFDGYTIGRTGVTVRFRLLVGDRQVTVKEKLHAERRAAWRGFSSEWTIEGLPDGTRVGLVLPAGVETQVLTAAGARATEGATPREAPVVLFPAGRPHALRVEAGPGAAWQTDAGERRLTLASAPAAPGRPVVLRCDWWTFTGKEAQPTAMQIASLSETSPALPARKEEAAATPPRPRPAPAREAPFTFRLEPIAGPPGWRPGGTAVASDGTVYSIDVPRGRVYRARFEDFPSPDWNLYAAGLNQPLGLALLDDRLFVVQRPEVTEIVARDRRGLADEYRSVTGGPWPLGDGYHEYAFGIAVGPDRAMYVGLNCGYFWPYGGATRRGRFKGSFLRFEASGRLEEFARGARVPNGLCRGPGGDLFFCDNQGDWIPVCKLAHLQRGRFYGHPESEADILPPGRRPDGQAACWLPYEHCRSASGPICDETGGRFGPFAGQIFLGDVGYGANKGLMRVALEKVGGEYQGACFRFLEDEPLGVQGLTFGPDGQMLASCLTSGLVRIRFGGRVPFEMHHLSLRKGGKGFVVHLTQPLADGAPSPRDFRVRRWHYRYSKDYGSPKFEEREVAVEKVEVAPDRRTLTLTLPVQAHPGGMVYYLQADNLRSSDGEALVHREAWYTVQRVDPE